MKEAVFILIFVLISSILSSSISIAGTKGYSIGLETCVITLGFPFLNVDVPIGEDYFNLGYTQFYFWSGISRYYFVSYRKSIGNDNYIKLGVLTLRGSSSSSSVPIFALEKEFILSDNYYWSLAGGYPEVLGLGIKHYF